MMMLAGHNGDAIVRRARRTGALVCWCVVAGLVQFCPALLPAASLPRRAPAAASSVALSPLPEGGAAGAWRPAETPRPNWTAWLGTGLLSTGPALLATARIVYLTHLRGATGL